MNKRGQVAIFVIVAMLVVVGVVLIYFFYPQIKVQQDFESNPSGYLKQCIEQDLKKEINALGEKAGYNSPEGIVMYKGNPIKYLCYTSEYYKTCVIQQSNLRENFEKELEKIISPKAEKCVDDLINYYESKGYSVSGKGVELKAKIQYQKVILDFEAPMTLTKEASQTYKNFEIIVDSQIYDLIMIAISILDFEASYGDADTSTYYDYYPNLKIEKDQLSDGTTIYSLSDVNTQDKFVFASRSLPWPPGYGFE